MPASEFSKASKKEPRVRTLLLNQLTGEKDAEKVSRVFDAPAETDADASGVRQKEEQEEQEEEEEEQQQQQQRKPSKEGEEAARASRRRHRDASALVRFLPKSKRKQAKEYVLHLDGKEGVEIKNNDVYHNSKKKGNLIVLLAHRFGGKETVDPIFDGPRGGGGSSSSDGDDGGGGDAIAPAPLAPPLRGTKKRSRSAAEGAAKEKEDKEQQQQQQHRPPAPSAPREEKKKKKKKKNERRYRVPDFDDFDIVGSRSPTPERGGR